MVSLVQVDRLTGVPHAHRRGGERGGLVDPVLAEVAPVEAPSGVDQPAAVLDAGVRQATGHQGVSIEALAGASRGEPPGHGELCGVHHSVDVGDVGT